MAEGLGRQSASKSRSVPPVVTLRSCRDVDSILIEGRVNGKTLPLVVDSGANRTLLRADVIGGKALPLVPGGLADVTGRITDLRGPTDVSLEVDGMLIRHEVYVADSLSDPCILGLDFLRQNNCSIDFGSGTFVLNGTEVSVVDDHIPQAPKAMRVRVINPVTVDPGVEAVIRCRPVGQRFESPGLIEAGPLGRSGLMVGRTLVDTQNRSFPVLVANLTDSPIRVRAGTAVGLCEEVEVGALPGPQHIESSEGNEALPVHLQELSEVSCDGLNVEQRQQVEDLLKAYADVFAASDCDLGHTSLMQHNIETGDSRPVKVPPRRIPIHKRQAAEEMVDQMAKQGLIEPSQSPWSSALVLVRKKDGSLRCCVDYRRLNAVTTKDSYPLPRIDDTLDALSGSVWFSTLDLKSGYHQISLAECDRPKTAFPCGAGFWQWRVLPFGLCNAPATFERLMEVVLSGLHWNTLLVYLDDVIVFGRTFKEELDRLKEVLDRMRSANLKLNPKKCRLFRKEVPFLGHVVSGDGVKTDSTKTSAVADWPVPENEKELRSFLGLCTYYRRFVKDFATIAAPLHALTKQGHKFVWTPQCQAAFDDLKQALILTPVLRYPDPNKTFILDTDASSCGIGSVLSQVHDGVEHVVAYYSRSLTSPERNYCTTRRELLAIVDSVRHFHSYLYGTDFTVRTDHSALQWLSSLRDPEGQLARWLARLGQYQYQIVHRSGSRHANADALSRRPCDPECRHCGRREVAHTDRACRVTTVSPGLGPMTPDHGPEVQATVTAFRSRLAEAQRSDPELAPLLKCMDTNPDRPPWEQVRPSSPETKRYWAQWELLKLQNGILQRRWETPSGSKSMWLDIIPRSMRRSLLAEMHGSIASGHFGVKKTLQRLRKRAYWLEMRRDVTEWCRGCEVCIAKKGPQQTPQAPVQVVQVGAPMERVAVDVAGPFPVSTSGNRFVVVVIDYFTKWPEVFPVPNQEAATVARVLVDGFFSRFGVPDELHSDQGRNFESALFKECCELLGIKKTRTTPLHPESDGMVERFNRTLVQELAKRCRHGQTDWDLHIPTILMAYRSAEHEATGHTPAELMLGRDLRLPVDLIMERPPTSDNESVPTTEYVRSLRDRMCETRATVEKNLKMASGAMKKRKDIRATMKPLEQNDRVWLFNPQRKKGLSPKLSSPWDGPYLVTQRLSAVTYRIRKGNSGKEKIVHFNRLWKVNPCHEFSWDRSELHSTPPSQAPDDPPPLHSERSSRMQDVEGPEQTGREPTPRPRRQTRPPDRLGY